MADILSRLGKGTLGAGLGAASGATLGSVVPGIGTAIGAGIGAGVGGIGGLLFPGSEESREGLSRFTPENQAKFDELIGQLLQRLGSNEFDFAPIAQQARSGFEQQTVPGLAERFTSLGAGRSSSPAFASQVGAVGAGLEQNLAALKSQYGLQRQQLLQNLLNLGTREPSYQPRTPGFAESLAGPLLQAGGQAAGSYLGSPAFAVKQNPELFKSLLGGGR